MKTAVWCVGTFLLTAYILFACTGCGFRAYENGKPIVAAYGDYEDFEYQSPAGTRLKVRRANHSKPTKDALDAVGRLPVGIGVGASPLAL